MWIIIAAGITVAVIVTLNHRRAKNSDLGWVTERWLTEYRADQAAHSK